jgi:hypothetical protein
VLIGLAAKSTAMCFITLGLITVYFAALLLFILKAKNKKKSSNATENASAEANDAE